MSELVDLFLRAVMAGGGVFAVAVIADSTLRALEAYARLLSESERDV